MSSRSLPISLLLVASGLLASCDVTEVPSVDASIEDGAAPREATRVAFDVSAAAGFFDAPFPIGYRLRDDGTLAVGDFPNPTRNGLVGRVLDALQTSRNGFGTTAAIFFRFDHPLDPPSLPASSQATLDAASSIFLLDVDPDSPGRGTRIPVRVAFKQEAETYSPPNTLVLLPEPGFALRPGTLHAAVVLDAVRDAWGRPIAAPDTLARLRAGTPVDGPHAARLAADFAPLWATLDRAGLDRSRVRAATVFRSGDPFREMDALRAFVAARPRPAATGLRVLRDHEAYCVVEGALTVPLFQRGARPFATDGAIAWDAAGAPVLTGEESIRFALTIPKRASPTAGVPLLFYAAGQGGAYTQVVDRGTAMEEAGATLGRGPSLYLASVGVATMSIEAPLVGPREPTGNTSGIAFFNVSNPLAFRDNTRQAAIDFTSLVRMAESLAVDPALCRAAAPVAGDSIRFDPSRFYFYGHSTGATVGALVLGVEPGIRAGLLSGAGGSWLYNLTIKTEPLPIAPVVRLLLRYDGGDQVDLYDPVLNLAQTLWEPTEAINWASRWARDVRGPGAAPRDVMIVEGILDGYFPPPAVNALAIAARAEPLSPTVEDTLVTAAAWVGGRPRPSGFSANLMVGSNNAVTAGVVQHAAPADVSGHYVPFELPGPKYQYRCFFDALVRTGRGVVVAPASDALAACPGG